MGSIFVDDQRRKFKDHVPTQHTILVEKMRRLVTPINGINSHTPPGLSDF